MTARSSDRNLVFGILALQMDLISHEDLIKGMNGWILNKQQGLGDLLVEEHVMSSSDRDLIDRVVERHVEVHNGDPEQSLAALDSASTLREDLEKIEDQDVQEAMTYVSMATPAAIEEATITHPGPGSPSGLGTQSSLDTRFRIVRPHAEGGLGKVSVAMDKELNREVALKEIKEGFSHDLSARTRFTLEAEITGGLEHPGIVPVYGLGYRDDGQPFYAMRFIKGDSLQDACKKYHEGKRSNPTSENALEFRKLLGRFNDVCNAIEYAHSRGVLHRDLKPGNIMLGKYGETLVVDWGLAKAIGREEIYKDLDEQTLRPMSSDSTPATQMGSALGTPHFMSPEQAAGKLDELGPASDVYSLGATLYYLLVNRAPFTEKNLDLLLAKVQLGEFEKPREVESSVPKPLEAICLKAMARDSADRYLLPNELADDISRWLADESVKAYSESFVEKSTRQIKRHKSLALAGILTFALVTIVSCVALFFVNESRLDERDARTLATEALRQKDEAELATVRQRVEKLRQAELTAVPGIIEELQNSWTLVGDELIELADAKDENIRLRGNLALYSFGETDSSYLESRLTSAKPEEARIIIDVLAPIHEVLAPNLWSMIENEQNDLGDKLGAVAYLAKFDPETQRWDKLSSRLAHALVATGSASDFSQWKKAFRGVGPSLVPATVELLDEFSQVGDQVSVSRAVELLCDYRADPNTLANALVKSDARDFQLLLTRALDSPEATRNRLVQILHSNPYLPEIDDGKAESIDNLAASVKESIKNSGGQIHSKFVSCQTLPLDQFDVINDALEIAGFRIKSCRPFLKEDAILVAAIWNPSTAETVVEFELTKERAATLHEEYNNDGFRAIDAAGYLQLDSNGDATDKYSAVWVKNEFESTRLYVGITESELRVLSSEDGSYFTSIQGFGLNSSDTAPTGYERYCCVIGSEERNGVDWNLTASAIDIEGMQEYVYSLSSFSVLLPESREELANRYLGAFDEAISENSENQSAYEGRWQMHATLGNIENAISDLTWLINQRLKNPGGTAGQTLELQFGNRAILFARLGDKERMVEDLAKIKGQFDRHFCSAYAFFLVQEFERGEYHLEQLLSLRNTNLDFHAAEVLAVAAETTRASDPIAAASYERRAFSRLEKLSYLPERIQIHLLAEPLRNLPGFEEQIARRNLDQSFVRLRPFFPKFESRVLLGETIGDSQSTHEEMLNQGFAPNSISCKSIGGRIVSSSVWIRDIITEEEKDVIAKQRARAIIALFQLGFHRQGIEYLAYESDPRHRTFVIHWCKEFDTPSPIWAHEHLEDPDLDSEVKIALLQLLGEFERHEFSDAEWLRLTDAVGGCYAVEHAGVHASAKWLLEEWGLDKPKHDRPWRFAGSSSGKQNQFFPSWSIHPQANELIEIAAGDYVVGSISHRDPDEEGSNWRRTVSLKNRIEIGSTTISVAQYQAFVEDKLNDSTNKFPDRDSWAKDVEERMQAISRVVQTPNSPMTKIGRKSIYMYCNWLSERSGIPEEEWCYAIDNETGALEPRPNCEGLSGFRLPTPDEWEVACRAGTTTRRHFGFSSDFMDEYGWFGDNSGDRTHPVGLKKPNDFGLFDTYGNVWQICSGDIGCGGDYDNVTANMRSSLRATTGATGYNHEGSGIRVARTIVNP